MTMSLRSVTAFALIALTLLGSWAAPVAAHQGPDPVMHWAFSNRSVSHGAAEATLGPDLDLPASAKVATDRYGAALDLTGSGEGMARSAPLGDAAALPSEALTVSAWVVIDEAEGRGGIVTLAQESGGPSGGPLTAWSLGYDDSAFTFTVRTTDEAGTNGTEGESEEVVVQGVTPYAKGRWLHVVGVYDGRRAELYVNGKLDAYRDAPSGGLVRLAAPFVAVGSTGDPERPSLRGKVRDVSVYDLAAKQEWVAHTFDHLRQLVAMRRDSREDALALVVKPYLQFGTRDGMTVMWQTTHPGTSVVRYGEDDRCERETTGPADATIHEVRLEGLEPETQYFYRTVTVDESGQTVESGVSTFSTAVRETTPFAFVTISDTQTNAGVANRVATHAWAQRPSFLLHPGDLVETGVNDAHWTQHFFPSLRPLISRVPFYSVLGNHEQNASNYYEYVSLPDPEYYYDFRYGNAHFFMIDTNRKVGPGSEQHSWLEKALAESDATWKFACHHHPPYSSDENDYGDLWKTNESARGDLRARQLSQLYDRHGVDIVWNGHIHSYERTWPVRGGKAVAHDGPIYMIVGGGGGGLESPGPSRPFFQNQVRRGHHYVMTHVNGPTLELRSYDLDDKLFDTVRIEKAE